MLSTSCALNMGVDPYNFVSALNCILAQRLVRVICDQVQHPVKLSGQRWTSRGSTWSLTETSRFMRGQVVWTVADRALGVALRSMNCWTCQIEFGR